MSARAFIRTFCVELVSAFVLVGVTLAVSLGAMILTSNAASDGLCRGYPFAP